jgi:hypothetical protein
LDRIGTGVLSGSAGGAPIIGGFILGLIFFIVPFFDLSNLLKRDVKLLVSSRSQFSCFRSIEAPRPEFHLPV